MRTRTFRFLATLGSVAALCAVPATGHAAAWVPGPAFAVGADASGGSVAEGPDNTSTAVWADGAGPAYVAHAQHGGADDALSAPFTLGPAAPPPAGSPRVVAAAGGVTAIAWLGYDSVDDDYPLHVAFLNAAGSVQHDAVVATLTTSDANWAIAPTVAVDAAGNATVAWVAAAADPSNALVRAARVTAATGAHSAPVTLGDFDGIDPPHVAAMPGGTSWVAWAAPDQKLHVARLTAAGAIDASDAALSPESTHGAEVVASAAGGALVWEQYLRLDGGVPVAAVTGVRLPASGALAGTGFHGPEYHLFPLARTMDAVLEDSGAVTAAWVDVDTSTSDVNMSINRFAPGDATAAAPLHVDGVTGSAFPEQPALAAAPGGTVVVGWIKAGGGLGVRVRSLTPEGTLSTPAAAIPVFTPADTPPQVPQLTALLGGDTASGILAVAPGGYGTVDPWTLRTFRFDAIPPALSVAVPATADVLTPVHVAATVADPADAPVTWDFGDGGTGRGASLDHVYARAGTYTVAATAADAVGNAVTVTRTIRVTTPAPPDARVGGPAPGGGSPAPGGRPPVATLAAAGLKVTRATRSGAKVVVTGTIARAATGKVTVVYAQKVGRKTVKVTKTTKISRGRWTITLRLPAKLTRGAAARAKGTVTATFAGTKTIKKATARRAVTRAKRR